MKNYFLLLLFFSCLSFGQTEFTAIKLKNEPTTVNDTTQVDLLVREKAGASKGLVRKMTWPYLAGLFVPYTGANDTLNMGNHPVVTLNKIGIGTYSPEATLDIYNDTISPTGSYVFQARNGATGRSFYIYEDGITGKQYVNNKGSGNVSTNNAFGWRTMENNTTGTLNTAFGSYALSENTEGILNSGFGYASLYKLAGGSRNVAFGSYGLYYLTDGGLNTAVGAQTGNQTGSMVLDRVTLVGQNAGQSLTTSSKNTFIGRSAGAEITTGSSNIHLTPGLANEGAPGVTTGSYNTMIGLVTGLAANDSNFVILADGQGNKAFEKNGTTGNVDLKGTSLTFNGGYVATESYADTKVADTITDGVTTIAPSQNAVFDAIASAVAGSDTVTSVTGVSGETTVANGTTNPVIGIDAAYTTARNTYADNKVANNLTASTTVAPSKTAVNTALSNITPTVEKELVFGTGSGSEKRKMKPTDLDLTSSYERLIGYRGNEQIFLGYVFSGNPDANTITKRTPSGTIKAVDAVATDDLVTLSQLNSKADDNAVVKTSGDQTALAGNKSWTGTHNFGNTTIDQFYMRNTLNQNRGRLFLGAASSPVFFDRNTADAVSTLVINNANASNTGNIIDFSSNINGTTEVRAGVRKDGRTFGVDGTDTNDYATVNQIVKKGGNTGVLTLGTTDNNNVQIIKNGISQVVITTSEFGLRDGMSLTNQSSATRFGLTTGSAAISPTWSRNTADAISTAIFNNANASNTGKIVEFQSGGSTVASIDKNGGALFNSNVQSGGKLICAVQQDIRSQNSNYFNLNTGNSNIPPTLTRSLPDTATTLVINNAHASNTGNIIDFQSVGSTVAKVTKAGQVEAKSFKISALNTAPASATAAGTAGEIRITSGYIYVCVATNTWVRSALSTW